MAAKLTKAEIEANIKRTGLPNPDYKSSAFAWLLSLTASTILMGIVIYVGIQANNDKVARQASSPHTTQAGVWMREVSALPKTPQRQVFISELGIALADGVISDEEHTNLSIDYETLKSK